MSHVLKSLVNTVSKSNSLLFIDVERRDTSPFLSSLILVFLMFLFYYCIIYLLVQSI